MSTFFVVTEANRRYLEKIIMSQELLKMIERIAREKGIGEPAPVMALVASGELTEFNRHQV